MEDGRRIILASQSPRRRELLAGLIKDFEVIPDNSEEVIEPGTVPEEAVCRLALQKAKNVAAKVSGDALIIAADTIVFIDDMILGKPSDKDEAFKMLHALSGRLHHVCTGYAVVDTKSGTEECAFETTVVAFKNLSDGEIKRYVESGEPMDKAGAYGIQNIGALFVKGIKGDYFNVVGLPLCALAQLLKDKFGYSIF